jgi:hypothetical protein
LYRHYGPIGKTEYTYYVKWAELRVKIKSNRKLALLFFLVCLVVLPFFLYGSIIALVIALVYLSRKSSGKKGIAGEKEVTMALQELDNSYYLLNDVVLYPKHGNIDHIVLGQNGIFAIETKNYKGSAEINA